MKLTKVSELESGDIVTFEGHSYRVNRVDPLGDDSVSIALEDVSDSARYGTLNFPSTRQLLKVDSQGDPQ